MKHPDFPEQVDTDPRPFPFRDLCSKLLEKGFDVRPTDPPAHWPGEDRLQGIPMTLFHWRYDSTFCYQKQTTSEPCRTSTPRTCACWLVIANSQKRMAFFCRFHDLISSRFCQKTSSRFGNSRKITPPNSANKRDFEGLETPFHAGLRTSTTPRVFPFGAFPVACLAAQRRRSESHPFPLDHAASVPLRLEFGRPCRTFSRGDPALAEAYNLDASCGIYRAQQSKEHRYFSGPARGDCEFS